MAGPGTKQVGYQVSTALIVVAGMVKVVQGIRIFMMRW